MAKAKTGVVISTKMQKTIVVNVESVRPHPLYHKSVKRTKKFHVHDELGAKVGDKVEFKETKPLSRSKRWIVVKVLPQKVKQTIKKVVKETKSKKS